MKKSKKPFIILLFLENINYAPKAFAKKIKSEKKEKMLNAIRKEFKEDSSVEIKEFIKKYDPESSKEDKDFSSEMYLEMLAIFAREQEVSEDLQKFSLKDFVLLEKESQKKKVSEIRSFRTGIKSKLLRERINSLLADIKFSQTNASVLIRELEAIEVSFEDLKISELENFQKRIEKNLKASFKNMEQPLLLENFLHDVEEALTYKSLSTDNRR